MNNPFRYISAAYLFLSSLTFSLAQKQSSIVTIAADEESYKGSKNAKAMALYNLGSRLSCQGGDYAKAAGFLEEAVRLDDTFVEALDNLSVC